MSRFRLITRQYVPWGSKEIQTEYVVQQFTLKRGNAWYAPLEWCDIKRFFDKQTAQSYLNKALERDAEYENCEPFVPKLTERARQPLFQDDSDSVLVPCIGVRITSRYDERTRSNDR